MEEWKCPIESLDGDIKEAVRLIYDNKMKPYMSCSGSYRNHKDKPYLPESACVEMLDSDLTRDLMAILINDRRFKCSISKARAGMCYDNNLPTGLRFKIEFENVCGNLQQEPESAIQSVVNGRSEIESRRRIDTVCKVLDAFNVEDGKLVTFSFNDEMVKRENADGDNYSISIVDRRDFEQFGNIAFRTMDGFVQDEDKFKIYGNDFYSTVSVLKKLCLDYPSIHKLRKGEKPHIVRRGRERDNRFTIDYNKKLEIAKGGIEQEESGELFSSQVASFSDLDDWFNGEL